ncbi:hypothetical protein [uncultured Tenacibaculum sp.]|uniref:hypothetical protein n=1 Tax=uncultured Tenacibaculum sp. TaxID=174713 RepID=UPI002604C89C|nr:hypothetical protein [uncultured Tenacibaculum sp.]
MKKQILNLGKVLNKTEQKQVIGAVTFTHEGDSGFLCYCNNTTYAVANCKWCGWMCGAGTIESCK